MCFVVIVAVALVLLVGTSMCFVVIVAVALVLL